MIFTADERRIVWEQYHHLCLPSLAKRPDWTIDQLKDSASYGGDYRIGRRHDRRGLHIEWRDWGVLYSAEPRGHCGTTPCRGPHLGQWIGICAPGARGHIAGVGPITDRTHTATLRWIRLHKWVTDLTNEERARLVSHGTAATADNLHWTLLDLIGPPPPPLWLPEPPPILVGDQYALALT